MKRFWKIFLTLSLAALLCLGVLPASAAEETWNVYAAKEGEDGKPQYTTPPAHLFTDRGLEVVPGSGVADYTVQTALSYSLDDGIYLEVRMSRQVKMACLAFHIWEQSGMLVGNRNCGSGWQGMVNVDQTNNQFVMSLSVKAASGQGDQGKTSILGTMNVNAPVNEDGSVTYSLSIRDGILRINDSVVAGTDAAISFLKSVRADGSFYFGVSMIMEDKTTSVPITVTRFGTSKDSASVPGQESELPETGEPSPETVPAAPDTTPPADESVPDSAPVDSDPSSVGTDPSPTESEREPVNSDTPVTREDDTVTDPSGDEKGTYEHDPDSPFRETETEKRELNTNEEMQNFISKLENMAFAGCGSLIGAGGLWTVLLAGLALLYLKKKNS